MSKRSKAPAPDTVRMVRCAVYTRKSSEDGLEQEFNSLDAQREAGEAYVRSQAGEGWTCLAERYDDGGFTGGNTDRPGLQRLMRDVEAGRVDCVVVYKVDRLTGCILAELDHSIPYFANGTKIYSRKLTLRASEITPGNHRGGVRRILEAAKVVRLTFTLLT